MVQLTPEAVAFLRRNRNRADIPVHLWGPNDQTAVVLNRRGYLRAMHYDTCRQTMHYQVTPRGLEL